MSGVGLLTGWGEGVEALADLRSQAGEVLVPVPTPDLGGGRFRRATRECLLAVWAARAAVRDASVPEDSAGGSRTGVVFASATSYAAANRAFLDEAGTSTLHFPYTSPSAVPGEVTIELGIRGPYVHLMGGGTAALQALWYAARWLARGTADRVLVLAVEAVHELRDLLAGARRLHRGPLVEGAACLVLDGGAGGELRWASGAARGAGVRATVPRVLDAVTATARPRLVAAAGARGAVARAQAEALAARGLEAVPGAGGQPGEMLALGPLVAVARAWQRAAPGPWLLTAAWQDDYGALLWPGRTDGRAVDRG